jgi:hypothetical protein
MEHEWRPEFEQAIGETFGDYVSPPVPYEDSSAHECCEVIWKVFGRNVTPTDLATMDEAQIQLLATAFGQYFECDSPTEDQIRNAVAVALTRWPPGSLGE